MAATSRTRSRRTTVDLNGPVTVRREGDAAVRAEARRSTHPVNTAWIPVENIDETPAELNSRVVYSDASINELAASIKELGILQPICVRPADGDRYMLVFGMRRLKAAIRAGLPEVPCTIQVADDDRAFLMNTVENLHRTQLSGPERVRAIERLSATNIGVRELGRRTGFHAATISRWLKIDRHPAIKAALARDSIDLGQAMELTRAPSDSVPGLLREVWNMGRTELREKVDETVALRSTTPGPPLEPARVRSLSVQDHSKILRGVLEDGGLRDLTASARNELGKLYRKMSVLLAE